MFKVRNVKIIDFLGRNNVLLFLTGIFAIGILCGCLLYSSSEPIKDLGENWFSAFLSRREKTGFFNVLLSVFWSLIPFQLACFFCGTSVVGSVVTPIVVALNGFFTGLLTAYSFAEYALLGIAFNGLIIIPSGVISAVGFLLCAKEAISFSTMLFKFSMPSSGGGQFYSDFKKYVIKNILFLVVLLVSAVLDAIISGAALKLFKL